MASQKQEREEEREEKERKRKEEKTETTLQAVKQCFLRSRAYKNAKN